MKFYLHQKSGYALSRLWCRFRVSTTWGMPVPSKVLVFLSPVLVYATLIMAACILIWVGLRTVKWKFPLRRLYLYRKSGYGLSRLWCRFRIGTPWGMSLPSKALVFFILQTCIRVYYHDNSGLYLGFDKYEGLPVEILPPDIVFSSENLVMVCLVCDLGFGLV